MPQILKHRAYAGKSEVPAIINAHLFRNRRLNQQGAEHRSAEFSRRLKILGIKGISLHSYRYAWAERALEAGLPERIAMKALGHSSKAIHHAYAKNAVVEVPSLENYAKD